MSLILSSNLKILLKREDIGVPTLSKRAKVPRQTIANWMAGQRPQNIEHVKAVADCFSVSVDELCFSDPLREGAPGLESLMKDIHAGIFEVVLRRVRG